MRRLLREEETKRVFLLSEYGRKKLLGYADSFQEIAKTLNEEFDWKEEEESRQSLLYSRKLWESKCMLADNLSEMADLMAQVAKEVFAYRPFPERKAKQIVQAMREEGIFVSDLSFVENDKKRTWIHLGMHACEKAGMTIEEAGDMLSVLLDVRLMPSIHCPYYIDGTLRNYTFVEESRFLVMTGTSRAVKEAESESGDNYTVLESERGKITLLLSDGMGSGQKACEDSEVVLDLMEKLIDAGCNIQTAVNLVNSTLVAKGEEQNMSTLDICQLDLYDGICEFTKIGAAPSFIKRGHMVEQITTGTLPLGIFKGISEMPTCRRLMDGDYIFLVSDGVVDAIEECDYKEDICEIIGSLEQENPKELSEAFLQIVLRKTRGRIRDDMTILVIGLWENL